MTNKSKRRKLLELQKRVAEISRRRLLSDLADAQTSENQSRELANRTRSMASEYAHEMEADFHERNRFAASLAKIALDANGAASLARDQTEAVGLELAQKDRHLDQIEDRLANEKRKADRKVQLRETTDGPALARNLLNQRQTRTE